MFQLLFLLACVSAGQHEIREALQPDFLIKEALQPNFLEVEQACSAGTSLQSLPQSYINVPSNAQFLPRSISCGTGQSNCSFCAPLGPYLTSPGSFVISARCTSALKNNVHASYSANAAGISISYGAYPAWDLTVVVSAPVVGYVLYEVCDSFNNYGSWVAPVGKDTPPTPPPSPTPPVPAACPAGTSLQALPQLNLPSSLQNVPRSSSLSCGTGQANCAFCAPIGSYLTSPGSFVISPRCTSTKTNTHASYSSNAAGINISYGPYPAWDLTVTVSAPVVGYVLYEVCDSFNGYGSWVAPVGVSAPPTPAPTVPAPICTVGQTKKDCSFTCACSQGGAWGCVDTCPPVMVGPPCVLLPNTVQIYPNCCPILNCSTIAPAPTASPQSNCNNILPQSTTLPATYPTWLQNPFTQAPKVTCGTGTSTLTVCAPSSPLVSGNYAISASTSPKGSYASWAGAGTPKVNGTYQGLTYTFTLTKSTSDSGYIKYEFCDYSNNYGSWVLFF